MIASRRPFRLAAALAATLALVLAAGCGGGDPSADDASPPAADEPTTPAPTPTPTPEPRTFTLVATGDVLLHERLWTQAKRDAAPDGTWNFAPQLASIQPVVAGAGLALCQIGRAHV